MLEKMKAEFEKWHRFPVTDDMDIHTAVAWDSWRIAWNEAITAGRDCRLCARYTLNTAGCVATAQCVNGDQFKATAPRQYWIAEGAGDGNGNPDTIAEHLRGMLADGTTQCPLCGETLVHTHSPREIVIYRNGIKYGRSLLTRL